MKKIKKRYKESSYLIPLYQRNKKGIEMGFNWLFSIIAGAFILFLAIYAASRFIDTGTVTANTLTAKNFVNIVETWEAGMASGLKPKPLDFKTETNLYFICDENLDLPFGREMVSSSDKIFNNRETTAGYYVPITNKYIFTEDVLSGKRFYPFSLGFFMPFKVADIIIFSDKPYCFYDTPNQVRRDLELLDIQNIIFANSSYECGGVSVCFGNKKDCNVSVSVTGNYVLKDGKRIYYTGSLMYAAIFSSPEIYNCNIKRIVNKFEQLAPVYIDKIRIIERKNCKSNVEAKMNIMLSRAQNFSGSVELRQLMTLADEIDLINNDADPGCKLYKNEEKY